MKPREGKGRSGNAIFALLCAIVIASVGTTAWAGWGNYTDPTGAIVYYWNDPLNVKFKYTTTRQWWDYSTVDTTWYTLTTTGSSGAFIGDGSWRDLGNGFVYSYNVTNDMAWFKKGTDGRFGYYYSPGRWMMTGNSGGWQYVGNSGLSASFLGDAGWHDLGNGFTYLYSLSSDLGWYKRTVGGGRFGYYYAPSRWMSTGNYGGWQYVGNAGLSASFLGDGAWHDLGSGFSYLHNGTSDVGWFKTGTLWRFGYYYTPSRWVDEGNYGSWQYLGNAGVAAGFVGDGAWHTLGNGFIYSYVASSDLGWFKNGADGRFGYYYTPSRWMTTGNYGGWQYIGAAGLSASFLGDGAAHDLGAWNGHWFFTYSPGTGYTNDQGQFSLSSSGNNRFAYGYYAGQWFDYDGGAAGWAVLGDSGASSAFIGDGLSHSLGSWHQPGSGNWYFTYNAGTGYTDDQGQFSLSASADNRFAYGYNSGQWYGYDYYGSPSPGWITLGDAAASLASFIGDGSSHSLGTWNAPAWGSWWFTYSAGTGYTDDQGRFGRGGTTSKYRFAYGYNDGQWFHNGALAGWGVLGSAGNSASFVGDGSWNQIVAGAQPWSYLYDSDWDAGLWYCSAGIGIYRFSYSYSTGPLGMAGQWSHYDTAYGGNNVIGAPVSLSSIAFIGDGGWYADNVDANAWWYSYDYTHDKALWARDAAGSQQRFSYAYGSGRWGHIAGVSGSLGSALLGDPTDLTTMRFIGLYNAQQIVSGAQPWWYGYDYSQDGGGWSRVDPSPGSADVRFGYDYTNGTWGHKEAGSLNFAVLGAATGSSLSEFTSFAADGGWGKVDGALFSTWYYKYDYDANTGFWARGAGGSDQRIGYLYNTLQWRHYDSVGGSNVIGAPISLGTLAFIGDGGWYADNVDANPWWYSYDYTNDNALWALDPAGTLQRFSYAYSSGQWGHIAGVTGSLGQAILGDVTDLTTLRFIGNGGWHADNVDANPWWYSYDYTNDRALWARDSAGSQLRFSYAYASGQWGHMAGVTGSLGSALLGDPTNLSTMRFIGLYSSQQIVFGTQPWWYGYDYSQDGAAWCQVEPSPGSADVRFGYDYTNGTWGHKEAGSTNFAILGALSGSSLNAFTSFAGDGGWGPVNGAPVWYYSYDYTANTGSWARAAAGADHRFVYLYNTLQWRHYDSVGGSNTIGAPVSLGSLAFMGDGGWHADNVDANTWWYSYDYGADKALWDRSATGDGTKLRFSYAYASGQWGHIAGVSGSLGSALLGDPTNLTAMRFIGLYAAQQIVSGAQPWWYGYDYSQDGAGWSHVDPSGPVDVRFGYDYANGTWGHKEAGSTNFAILGAATGSSLNSFTSFAGDGGWGLVNGAPVWYYSYDYTNNEGSWSLNAGGVNQRFKYLYNTLQWRHYDSVGGNNTIGAPVSLGSLGFMGDGGWHADNVDTNTWWYSYDYGNDKALWDRSATGDGSQQRFSYAYASGQWGHIAGVSGSLGSALLGDTTNLTAMRFIGRYAAQQIVSGAQPWWYAYDYSQDGGGWSQVDPGAAGADVRFGYDYANGTWSHKEAGSTNFAILGALSGSSLNAFTSFAGDGGWGLVNGAPVWYYSYDYTANTGSWARAAAGADHRFVYLYNTLQWRHYDSVGGNNTIGAPVSLGTLAFIGDGGWHADNVDTNAWWYSYAYGDDKALWDRSASGDGSQQRFSYAYASGQWGHIAGVSGSLGSALLGDTTNLTTMRFIGLYNAQQIVSGGQPWWYGYDYSQDGGGWSQVAPSGPVDVRFGYDYANGTWGHKEAGSTTFAILGALSGSSLNEFTSFAGDGGWGLVNGAPVWYYSYDYTNNEGSWSLNAGGADKRFAFAYSSGQWSHYDAYGSPSPGWVALGDPGVALADYFMGDGTGHNLGTWNQPGTGNWWFSYDAGTGASDDKGQFGLSSSGNYRFAYVYNSGQWQFYEQGATWKSIGGAGQSLASFFIGDGSAHSLYSGDHWTLQYIAADDRFLITQTATGYQYLAYSFAGPYWMDGGNGYPLAQITGGSSPYWYWSEGTGGMNLHSSGPVYMNLYIAYIYWDVTYYGASDIWTYVAALAQWYLNGGFFGSGGPGDHRQ